MEAKTSKKKGCLKVFLWFFGVVFLFSLFSKLTQKDENKEEPTIIFFDDRYYSKWSDDVNEDFIKIAKTLNQNNIRGCGEFYYIKTKGADEYVVGCANYTQNSTPYYEYYGVWSKINKVSKITNDRKIFEVKKEPILTSNDLE